MVGPSSWPGLRKCWRRSVADWGSVPEVTQRREVLCGDVAISQCDGDGVPFRGWLPDGRDQWSARDQVCLDGSRRSTVCVAQGLPTGGGVPLVGTSRARWRATDSDRAQRSCGPVEPEDVITAYRNVHQRHAQLVNGHDADARCGAGALRHRDARDAVRVGSGQHRDPFGWDREEATHPSRRGPRSGA